MPAAIPPETVKNISGVQSALIVDAKNVKLNLETAQFDVTDAKGKVVKSIAVPKGHDAIYVINYSEKPEDIESASAFMKSEANKSSVAASTFETRFAEVQDEMIRNVQIWRSAAPGANKAAQSLVIGKLQRELAAIERNLRTSQYSYREVLELDGVKRRLYDPPSNDERKIPFDVVKLSQTLNLSKQRNMPTN